MFLSIALSLGGIGLLWRMIWRAGLRDILQQIMLMLIVGLAGVGIKARVVIIDPTSGTIPIYGTVDNVPWSVAVLGYYTTGISYQLTSRMETLLSTPDNISYQQSGMLFGATLLSQAAHWRAVSPQIYELLVNYMHNCVIDGTMLGHTRTHPARFRCSQGSSRPGTATAQGTIWSSAMGRAATRMTRQP